MPAWSKGKCLIRWIIDKIYRENELFAQEGQKLQIAFRSSIIPPGFLYSGGIRTHFFICTLPLKLVLKFHDSAMISLLRQNRFQNSTIPQHTYRWWYNFEIGAEDAVSLFWELSRSRRRLLVHFIKKSISGIRQGDSFTYDWMFLVMLLPLVSLWRSLNLLICNFLAGILSNI